jgi:hypothetical protein
LDVESFNDSFCDIWDGLKKSEQKQLYKSTNQCSGKVRNIVINSASERDAHRADETSQLTENALLRMSEERHLETSAAIVIELWGTTTGTLNFVGDLDRDHHGSFF